MRKTECVDDTDKIERAYKIFLNYLDEKNGNGAQEVLMENPDIVLFMTLAEINDHYHDLRKYSGMGVAETLRNIAVRTLDECFGNSVLVEKMEKVYRRGGNK